MVGSTTTIDGERSDWVLDPRGLINKDNLTFVAKFFWLLIRHRLSPTNIDTVLTWDRAVLVATMVVKLEVDYAQVLISVIYERDFKTSTTYPFACLIFRYTRKPECQFGIVTRSVAR